MAAVSVSSILARRGIHMKCPLLKREIPVNDFDPFGGGFQGLELIGRIFNFLCEGALAGPSFANDDEFGFAQTVNAGFTLLAPVALDCLDPLLHHFRWGRLDIMTIKIEPLKARRA